jgi:hypothetical protein
MAASERDGGASSVTTKAIRLWVLTGLSLALVGLQGPPAAGAPLGDVEANWRSVLAKYTLTISEAAALLGVSYPISPDHRIECDDRGARRLCTWEYLMIPYELPFTAPVSTTVQQFATAEAARAELSDWRGGVGLYSVVSGPNHVASLVIDDKSPDSHVAIRHLRKGALLLTSVCSTLGADPTAALKCTRNLSEAMLAKWRDR